MLKRMRLSLGILVGITLGFVVTNPTKQDYAEHVVWTIQNTACQQESQSNFCPFMAALPPDLAKKMVKEYSQRRNFVFFSLYSTNFFGLKSRSIGVGKVFMAYDNDSFILSHKGR
jgi:Domain of unknown function (DUF4359)